MTKLPVAVITVFVIAWLAGCGDARDLSASYEWPDNLQSPMHEATFSLARSHLAGEKFMDFSSSRQGFDFVNGTAGRLLVADEEVVAVADGKILRIDRDYVPADKEELVFWAAMAEGEGFGRDYALDRLHGRQVWIRHDTGHVSRYSHLSEVRRDLTLGDRVEQGEPVGLMGRTGIPPTEHLPEPQPRLHFQLWNQQGDRYLGQGLTGLEIHQLLSRVFSDEALPRYARQVLADLAQGQAGPGEYPPAALPNSGFSVESADAVVKGVPFAAPITWDNDDFRAHDFFASANGRPLGIIEAPDGAWILGVASGRSGEGVMVAIVGATDAFGQTVAGRREVPLVTPDTIEPLEVDAEIIQRYSPENQETEASYLEQVGMFSLQTIRPEWQRPFMMPVDGDIVQQFNQRIFHGVLRPDHPAPGVTIVPEGAGQVVASNDGVVALVDTLPIRGNVVALDHGGGVVSVYAHLDRSVVQPGDRVERGEKLGIAGQSGAAPDSLQVRWEIHVAGVPGDPMAWVGRVLP